MKEILEKYCIFIYKISNNTTFVFNYKWLQFYFHSKINRVDMYFSDDNYHNNEAIEFETAEKLETFLKGLI